MQIIDPQGRYIRTIAIPRPADVAYIANWRAGKAAFDRDGNLVYRSAPRLSRSAAAAGNTELIVPDSTALLRVWGNGELIDTITFVKIPVPRTSSRVDSTGKATPVAKVNPLPIVDDWGVFSDGAIGVVRGRDLRLEIFRGKQHEATFKIPYEWRRLTLEEKAALVDSATNQRAKSIVRNNEQAKLEGHPPAPIEDVVFFDPPELPDYFPAFELNAVLMDPKDRFWVRALSTTSTVNNTFYIVDRGGKVLYKVELPKIYELLDFGQDGSVYLLRASINANPPPLTFEPRIAGGSAFVIVRAYVSN